MFGSASKRVFLGIIVASFVIPVGIMLWNVRWGAVALLVGLVFAMRSLALVRSIQRDGAVQDQRALYTKRDRGRTIYVALVDAAGNDLPEDVARAKVAAAHAAAGPRDTVMGVRRTIA